MAQKVKQNELLFVLKDVTAKAKVNLISDWVNHQSTCMSLIILPKVKLAFHE